MKYYILNRTINMRWELAMQFDRKESDLTGLLGFREDTIL
jgi:hypothetical protein